MTTGFSSQALKQVQTLKGTTQFCIRCKVQWLSVNSFLQVELIDGTLHEPKFCCAFQLWLEFYFQQNLIVLK